MTTKLVDGQKYEVKEISGFGSCLVPVKDPIFKVGDRLMWNEYPYMIYCTASNCANLTKQYGVLYIGVLSICGYTLDGRLFDTLEELSTYVRSFGFTKVN